MEAVLDCWSKNVSHAYAECPWINIIIYTGVQLSGDRESLVL